MMGDVVLKETRRLAPPVAIVTGKLQLVPAGLYRELNWGCSTVGQAGCKELNEALVSILWHKSFTRDHDWYILWWPPKCYMVVEIKSALATLEF